MGLGTQSLEQVWDSGPQSRTGCGLLGLPATSVSLCVSSKCLNPNSLPHLPPIGVKSTRTTLLDGHFVIKTKMSHSRIEPTTPKINSEG